MISAFDILNNAASSYIEMRSIINTWGDALSSAEREFWDYYDQHGKVNSTLRDEFGYWLHRRETWEAGLLIKYHCS